MGFNSGFKGLMQL